MPYPYPDRSQGELHAHCDNTAGFAAYEDDACKAAAVGHQVMGHPEDSKVRKPQRSQSMIEFRTLAHIIDGVCVCELCPVDRYRWSTSQSTPTPVTRLHRGMLIGKSL